MGMGRLINSESAGKDRTRLTKTVVIAIRELLRQKEPGDLSRDLIACVLMSLDEIYETVDASVEAWEKRGYWLKADRFRMEWEWTRIIADRMRPLVLSENYGELIPMMVEILQALELIPRPEEPPKKKPGRPKGSKSKPVVKGQEAFPTEGGRKRGRPKGSKNKPKSNDTAAGQS